MVLVMVMVPLGSMRPDHKLILCNVNTGLVFYDVWWLSFHDIHLVLRFRFEWISVWFWLSFAAFSSYMIYAAYWTGATFDNFYHNIIVIIASIAIMPWLLLKRKKDGKQLEKSKIVLGNPLCRWGWEGQLTEREKRTTRPSVCLDVQRVQLSENMHITHI